MKIFFILLFSVPVVFFSSTASSQDQLSGRDLFYVVETDEEMKEESLDRISGHIDTGFASEEQSYISESHYGVGPFAQEKS